MNTTTTRRALIASAPAAAVAFAIPASAASLPRSEAWAKAKADYAAGHAEMMRRIDLQTEAEEKVGQFLRNAPAPCRVSYYEEGFTQGAATLTAHRATHDLTVHTYRSRYLPSGLVDEPEYMAFRKEADAWRNDPAHVAAVEASEAAFDYTRGGHDAENAAYEALLACPVASVSELREKLAIGHKNDMDDEGRRGDLLDAIAADLTRLAGEA